MVAAIHLDSPWADILQHVSKTSLVDLCRDEAFVSVLHGRQSDMGNDQYLAVHEILTDMFHDHFDMRSKQRKLVLKHLMDHTKDIRQLFITFETGYPVDSGPYLPGRVEGGVEGLAGPYPVKEPMRGELHP